MSKTDTVIVPATSHTITGKGSINTKVGGRVYHKNLRQWGTVLKVVLAGRDKLGYDTARVVAVRWDSGDCSGPDGYHVCQASSLSLTAPKETSAETAEESEVDSSDA